MGLLMCWNGARMIGFGRMQLQATVHSVFTAAHSKQSIWLIHVHPSFLQLRNIFRKGNFFCRHENTKTLVKEMLNWNHPCYPLFQIVCHLSQFKLIIDHLKSKGEPLWSLGILKMNLQLSNAYVHFLSMHSDFFLTRTILHYFHLSKKIYIEQNM